MNYCVGVVVHWVYWRSGGLLCWCVVALGVLVSWCVGLVIYCCGNPVV